MSDNKESIFGEPSRKIAFTQAASKVGGADLNDLIMKMITGNIVNREIKTEEDSVYYELNDPKYGTVSFYHKPGMDGRPMMEFRLSEEFFRALDNQYVNQAAIFHKNAMEK